MTPEAWAAFAMLAVSMLGGLIHISIKIGRLTAVVDEFRAHRAENDREHESLWDKVNEQRDWIVSLRRKGS